MRIIVININKTKQKLTKRCRLKPWCWKKWLFFGKLSSFYISTSSFPFQEVNLFCREPTFKVWLSENLQNMKLLAKNLICVYLKWQSDLFPNRKSIKKRQKVTINFNFLNEKGALTLLRVERNHWKMCMVLEISVMSFSIRFLN